MKQEQVDALFTIEALEDASRSPQATLQTLPEPTLDTVHKAFAKAQKAATIRDTVIDALAKTHQIVSSAPSSESATPADTILDNSPKSKLNKVKTVDSLSKSKLTQELAESLNQSNLDKDLRWMPTEMSYKAAAAAEHRDATAARLRDVGRKLTEFDAPSATDSTPVVRNAFTFLQAKHSFSSVFQKFSIDELVSTNGPISRLNALRAFQKGMELELPTRTDSALTEGGSPTSTQASEIRKMVNVHLSPHAVRWLSHWWVYMQGLDEIHELRHVLSNLHKHK